jgi:hypothetical protein
VRERNRLNTYSIQIVFKRLNHSLVTSCLVTSSKQTVNFSISMGLDRCLLKSTDSALSLLRVSTSTSTSAVKAKIGKSAEFITKTIRSHWHVENKLHWQLDISFNEYYNRLRSGNTADNFALMKKIAKINGV